MSTVRFDAGYREDVVLTDGTRVTLRLLRPEDKPLLAEGLARLSPESRFRRFHAAKPTLSEAELRYLTDIDGVRHFAIGAVQERPGQPGLGLGIARFIRLPGPDDIAEPAVVVVDEFQGRGLGRLLLERLVAAARERGIRSFSAVVQGDNEPVLSIVHAFAPEASARIQDAVVTLQVPLTADEPAEPESAPGTSEPRSLLRRLLAMAANGVFELVHDAAARLRALDSVDQNGAKSAETGAARETQSPGD